MALQFLKRSTQSDSILQSLRPLAYISLIGLAPFRLSVNKEVRTSAFSLAAGILHFLFYVLCFFLSLHEGDSIISYFFQTSVTRLGDATLSLSGIIAMVMIFSSIFFKVRKKFRKEKKLGATHSIAIYTYTYIYMYLCIFTAQFASQNHTKLFSGGRHIFAFGTEA